MSSAVQSSPGPAASSSRNATKRLLKEIETWQNEQPEETGIERLGPVGEENLFEWEAVINGRDVGFGYDGMFVLNFCRCTTYMLFQANLRPPALCLK